MIIINTVKLNIARTIVIEDPSGSTVTGRTSGETVMAPKGQISVNTGIISQAKGQSTGILNKININFQRSNRKIWPLIFI